MLNQKQMRNIFGKIAFYPVCGLLGFGLVGSGAIACLTARIAISAPLTIAQAQLTATQLPPASAFPEPAMLDYGDRVRNNLTRRSHRHEGRLFHLYQFEGEAEQLVRANLVGGAPTSRNPGELQTGTLLLNPVLVLLDPAGNIVTQQPEGAGLSNALIRLTLPATGTYSLLVTSANVGIGGRYTLSLEQLNQDGTNTPIR
jgi:hypothetical protein